ncbi:hypothetical protein ARTHRO9AX_180179 [Arthrobacter sp. 9AX]|uniref:hypothetical protein n=1 Tax=Arthrobacter sp. 9AX TaxID=2653131 RepID=UPI0012EFBA10|nr:hypothetical protein [Arthrobacter sp. 9AX]VXB48778.1 hypothetical protein ARTHRO9AX_180179 [Arthrobacter sp. 9AX]
MNTGAGQLNDGVGLRKAGFAALAEKLNATDLQNPGVVLGTSMLADGNARIAAGTRELPTKVAAVSPSSWLDNPAIALLLMALLLGVAVVAYLAIRRRAIALRAG